MEWEGKRSIFQIFLHEVLDLSFMLFRIFYSF